MKKAIFFGLAMVMSVNSVSIAASDRVQAMQELTAQERASFRNELLSKITEAEQGLELLKKELKDTQDDSNYYEVFSSVSVTVLFSLTSVISLAGRNEITEGLNKKQHIQLAGLTALGALIAGLMAADDIRFMNLNDEQVFNITEKIKVAESDLAALKTQLVRE